MSLLLVSVLFVSFISFSYPLPQSQILSEPSVSTLPVVSRQFFLERDICRPNLNVSITTFECAFSPESFISDADFDFQPAQCRSLCTPGFGETFDTLRVTRFLSFCSACATFAILRSNFTFVQFPDVLFGGLLQQLEKYICIPRQTCIDTCGPELPGCVYTGSCSSQLCFSSAVSNKTAQVKRYTHRGQGTVLLIDETIGPGNGTLREVVSAKDDTLDGIFNNSIDYCPDRGASFPISASGDFEGPLTDGRRTLLTKSGQCRVPSTFFNFSEYEVVRVPTNCDYCDSSLAALWISFDFFNKYTRICIPREICIQQCGTEGYGCVYTGSCQSRICFSGIDSKLPAVFTRLSDDGTDSEISVDNSGGPVDNDPPVFGPLGSRGDATSVPSIGEELEPEISPMESPNEGGMFTMEPEFVRTVQPGLDELPFTSF